MSLYDSASLYDNGTTFDGYPAGLATQPVVGVFIAFNDGAYVAEPDWLEVTQYVRNINVRRGRGDDLQNFPSGSASVTLDNRLRLFDPFNTASIYNGKLKPRRQIKIVGQWAGVNYPMFRGYIAGWPVGESDAGKDSTVTLDCFDALGLLAAETTAPDWAEYYINQLSPKHFWRCNDSQGSQIIVDRFAAGEPDLTMFTTTSNSYLVETEPMASGLVSNSAYLPGYTKDAGVTNTDVTDFTTMFWLLNPSQQAGGESDLGISYNGVRFEIQYQNTADMFVDFYNQTRRTRYTISGLRRQTPNHLAFVVSANPGSDPTAVIYVNGEPRSFSVSYNATLAVTNKKFINTFAVQLQDIVFATGIATAAQVANVYGASIGRINQTTLGRSNSLLSFTSFPTALTSFSSTMVSSLSELISDQYFYPELQKNADSENGELFVDRAGVLTFVGRNYFAESARSNTPQIVFTDTGTGVGYDAKGLQMMFDADKIRNEVTVTFTGGGNQSSSSSTSIAENGAAAQSVATYLATPTEAKTLADFLVTIYKNPKLRVDPFSVNGGRDPSYAWPLLLSLELLDRFTFKRTPTVGSAIQQDMLLQSVEHQITPGSWVTTVNGSARYTGWFTVGVSLIGGTDVLL